MKKIVLLLIVTFLLSLNSFANLNIDSVEIIDLNFDNLEFVVFNFEIEADIVSTCMDEAIAEANLYLSLRLITQAEWFQMVLLANHICHHQ
jgi:signal transduction histidine kinase